VVIGASPYSVGHQSEEEEEEEGKKKSVVPLD
jgi:hypothetical protein